MAPKKTSPKKKPTFASEDRVLEESQQQHRDREDERMQHRAGVLIGAITENEYMQRMLAAAERNTAAMEKAADAFARLATYGAHLVNHLESELDPDGTPKSPQPSPERNSNAPLAAQSAATSEQPADVAATSYKDTLKQRIAEAHEKARLARRAGDPDAEMAEKDLALTLEHELSELNG